jgi:RES domain-containing protein
MLEVLGHWQKVPIGLMLITISTPEIASVLFLEADRLPDDWRNMPYLPELANITDQWIRERKHWILRAPSVHSPTEYNYLLNPLHPEHATLKLISVEPHPFDPRLK